MANIIVGLVGGVIVSICELCQIGHTSIAGGFLIGWFGMELVRSIIRRKK